ncbi:MAG: hypothetical protein L0I29_10465 [Hyphomicrobiales bacterium]|nr:hypothetical protein [Hyphomicrobiales bacterium]
MNPFTLAPMAAIGRYAANLRALRQNIRTERILNALPANVRRDIGWPEIYEDRRSWWRRLD